MDNSKPLGFILSLTDSGLAHLVYPDGSMSIAVPVRHIYEMIADGDMPNKWISMNELYHLLGKPI